MSVITPALLTSAYDSVNAFEFTTASITVTAGKPVAVMVSASETFANINAEAPAVTGAGQTWELRRALDWDTVGLNRGGSWVFTSPATGGGSGILSINFLDPDNILGCAWSVVEFDGADSTEAFLNFADTGVEDAGTSNTVTLAALTDSSSIAVGMFTHRANEVTTFGSGFTELSDDTGTAPAWAHQTEWKLNTTTVDASWVSSVQNGGIAFEVKASAGSPALLDFGMIGRGSA